MSDLDQRIARAWPAEREQRLGAWWLRANGGFTKRANSALACGDPGLPLEAAVAEVERFYAALGLPARVQQTLAPDPHLDGDALAAVLRAAGFTPHDRTLVQVADVSKVLCASEALRKASAERWRLRAMASPDEDWFETFWSQPSPERAHFERQARALVGPSRSPRAPRAWFVLGCRDGVGLATGQGVLDADFVGVQCMATHPTARRAGGATEVLYALASWASARGAQRMVLGVVAANEPAIRLYARAGFATAHSYLYWTQ